MAMMGCDIFIRKKIFIIKGKQGVFLVWWWGGGGGGRKCGGGEGNSCC